jgi:RNA polymerase sigma factor (sigma-70 family)
METKLEEAATHLFSETEAGVAHHLTLDEFNEMYEKHRDFVRSIVMRIVCNTHGAEDVTQEVFFRAWKASYKSENIHWRAWFAKTARNAAIDYRRREKRQSTIRNATSLLFDDDILSTDALIGDEEKSDVPTLAISDEQHDAIEQALNALSSGQRQALLLNIEGYSYPEIAAHTHALLPTVKSRIRMGREHMWRKLHRFFGL